MPAKPLDVGDKAPDFALLSTTGQTLRLADYLGKQRVVLYFYPRDNTPGCTKEACSFRDNLAAIQAKGAVVLGVSPDSQAAHQKFTDKFQLNFPLLVDADKQTAQAYGAYGEKTNYGKTTLGIIRKTFVIGLDGKIAYADHKVKTEAHAEAILQKL